MCFSHAHVLFLFLLQKLQTIGEDFCGLDVNTPLGGEQPVSAVPVLLFPTRLTAVVATSTGDFTVVFIGTAKGHLKKVRRKLYLHKDFIFYIGKQSSVDDAHFQHRIIHIHAE